MLAVGGCSAPKQADPCLTTGRPGSIQVARVDPKVEEGGVAFDLLGDGKGDDVLLCGDSLYADVNSLAKLMGDSSNFVERNGLAVVNGDSTTIRAYDRAGVLYVAVAPYVRSRRAVLLAGDQPMDAIVWPYSALLHLKNAGLTEGRAYKAAVRDGLMPE